MPRHKLTAKQQIFLEELLANGGNAAATYRAAIPDNCTASSVSAAALRLWRHPLILQALGAADAVTRQAVDEALNRYRITAARVADELARCWPSRAFRSLRTLLLRSSGGCDDARRAGLTVGSLRACSNLSFGTAYWQCGTGNVL